MVKIVVGHARSAVRAPRDLFNDLRRHFSIERSYTEWRFDKRLRYMWLIDHKGFFPSGLLPRVISLLKEHEVEYEVVDTRSFGEYDEDLETRYERIKNMKSRHRPYQIRAVKTCLKKRRGTVYMATGTGKTYVMASVCVAYKMPTLVMCGKKELAQQLRDELSQFIDEEVGLIGGGVFDVRRVTVAIVASLISKKMAKAKRKKVEELLDQTKVVLVDESHHIAATTYQEAMDRIENAGIRLGFTASPYTSKVMTLIGTKVDEHSGEERYMLSKERQSDVILQLHTGPVIFQYGIVDAINDGFLAKPEIIMPRFSHNVEREDIIGLPYVSVYTDQIVCNYERNRSICEMIAKESIAGPVVVFVQHVDHGFSIRDILINEMELDPDSIVFMHGELGKSERSSGLGGFKSGSYRVLIGTSIITEGLNFLATAGFNVAAGDSDIAVVQRLGRLLRKPRRGDDVDRNEDRSVKFYDVADAKHPWFEKHSRSRKKMYVELGFDVKRGDNYGNTRERTGGSSLQSEDDV